MKYKPLFYLSLVIFIAINVYTAKPGHSWQEDLGQYLQHASNIASADPYDQGLILNYENLSTPGFPLLLMPNLKFFGLNFKLLKLWNIFWWAIFAFCFLKISEKWVDQLTATLLGIFVLSTPFFFTFKQNILPDLPFLAFIWLAILAYLQSCDSPIGKSERVHRIYFALYLFFIGFAFLISYSAIVIMIAILFIEMFVRKDHRRTLGILATFIACTSLLLILGINLLKNFGMLNITFKQLTATWLHNTMFLFKSILLLICPAFLRSNYHLPSEQRTLFLVIMTMTALAIFLGIFAFIAIKRKLKPLGIIFLFYFMWLILWPSIKGENAVLPIYALAVLFLIKGGGFLLTQGLPGKIRLSQNSYKIIIQITLSIIILVNIFSIAPMYRYDNNEILTPETFNLLEWMDSNLSSNDVFMSQYAPVLAFLTNKTGVTPPPHANSQKAIADYIKRYHVNFLILPRGRNTKTLEQNYATFFYLEKTWDNPNYIIYQAASL